MIDVLIHTEDPGAANYVADLPSALARRGVSAKLLGGGLAQDHLRALGVSFESLPRDSDAATVLKAYPARLVLVGTSEDRGSLGLALIAAARVCDIPTLGVVDGPAHSDERFRGAGATSLAFAPDCVLVPDEVTRRAFVALGMEPDSVVATGHPLYDRVRASRAQLDAEGVAAVRRRMFPFVPPGRPIVTFLAERSDGLRPELYRRHAGYRLRGRGNSDARTDIVIEEFLDASAPLCAHRVLRLHPKNGAEEFVGYAGEFDSVSGGGAPHDLIYASDLVVGMTTILLVEAVLLGKSTLSIVPDPAEAAWLPTAGSELTPVLAGRVGLQDALREALSARPDVALTDRALPAGAEGRVIDIIIAMLGQGVPSRWRPEKESA